MIRFAACKDHPAVAWRAGWRGARANTGNPFGGSAELLAQGGGMGWVSASWLGLPVDGVLGPGGAVPGEGNSAPSALLPDSADTQLRSVGLGKISKETAEVCRFPAQEACLIQLGQSVWFLVTGQEEYSFSGGLGPLWECPDP